MPNGEFIKRGTQYLGELLKPLLLDGLGDIQAQMDSGNLFFFIPASRRDTDRLEDYSYALNVLLRMLGERHSSELPDGFPIDSIFTHVYCPADRMKRKRLARRSITLKQEALACPLGHLLKALGLIDPAEGPGASLPEPPQISMTAEPSTRRARRTVAKKAPRSKA